MKSLIGVTIIIEIDTNNASISVKSEVKDQRLV
jgi:hypothetical protein